MLYTSPIFFRFTRTMPARCREIPNIVESLFRPAPAKHAPATSPESPSLLSASTTAICYPFRLSWLITFLRVNFLLCSSIRRLISQASSKQADPSVVGEGHLGDWWCHIVDGGGGQMWLHKRERLHHINLKINIGAHVFRQLFKFAF
jgi:hypothetical protein